MPINRVTIVGNLTRDPDLRGLPSGGSVCTLRVAVNERRKDNQTGQWNEVPNYFTVTVFGNSADNCAKFLSKGRQVAVDGRLRWREWEKDGLKREAVEIVAQDVQFIGGQGGAPGGGAPGQGAGYGGGQSDDWGGGGGGGGGQQGGGGFNGPGTSYPVDQGDFGGGGNSGGNSGGGNGGGGGGWSGGNEAPRQAPAPTPAPADDDIPF